MSIQLFTGRTEMSPGTSPLMICPLFYPAHCKGFMPINQGSSFSECRHPNPYTVMSFFREACFPNTPIFPNYQPLYDLSPHSKFHPHPQPASTPDPAWEWVSWTSHRTTCVHCKGCKSCSTNTEFHEVDQSDIGGLPQ